jgi:hypothetical protein
MLRPKLVKIISRVSEADYKRLQTLAKDSGIPSVYSLMNYIAYCFLRVADAKNDNATDPIPTEIIKMFDTNYREDINDIQAAIIGIRKARSADGSAKREGTRADRVHEDVRNIFDEAETMGCEFVDNIRKRQER